MPRRNLGWLLGITAVALFGLAVSTSAPVREKDRDYEMVKLLIDVLHEVRQKYVKELNPEQERKLVEDMINGGLDRLDPHSAYINPKEYKQFSKTSKGSFGGIGIQLGYDRQKGGALTIISPMVGTPAYEAGILAGDVIVKIDGKSTENMRLSEAVELIQGEPGEKLTLTVLHESTKDPVDIPLTRARIKVPGIMGDQRKADDPSEWEYLIDKTNKIAYIRLVSFSETAPDELRQELKKLEHEGLRGLILDLRNNPGGLLRSAEEVADLFLTDGVIVSTRGRPDKDAHEKEKVREARVEGTLLTPSEQFPMVVLINKYSASASEIVAAALQDHKRAVIIGERSYGKGSVQNVIQMEGNTSALKLTTASYWRPSGKNIHRFPDSKDSDEWGVKPNPGFEVTLKDEERMEYLIHRNERDIVHGKPGTPPPPPRVKPEKDKDKKPFEDRVLQKALDYLRGEIKKLGAIAPVRANG